MGAGERASVGEGCAGGCGGWRCRCRCRRTPPAHPCHTAAALTPLTAARTTKLAALLRCCLLRAAWLGGKLGRAGAGALLPAAALKATRGCFRAAMGRDMQLACILEAANLQEVR